ncbi:hypothetical protein [Novipirellula aureliae]|uniref:hypothetical protein n=1 Tax=Novipirellula aureliae TaxID=2527966 RepID=UPI0011B622CB|nr:hypothetical protein [Novipirellula aureliae]
MPDCIGKWCPDDYCAKTEPCVRVPLCLQRDDYCPKTEPCVRVPLCFGPDDYEQKCLPKVCDSPRCDLLGDGLGSNCSGRGEISCDGLLLEDTGRLSPVVSSARIVSPVSIVAKPQRAKAEAGDKTAETPTVFVAKLPFEFSKR